MNNAVCLFFKMNKSNTCMKQTAGKKERDISIRPMDYGIVSLLARQREMIDELFCQAGTMMMSSVYWYLILYTSPLPSS